MKKIVIAIATIMVLIIGIFYFANSKKIITGDEFKDIMEKKGYEVTVQNNKILKYYYANNHKENGKGIKVFYTLYKGNPNMSTEFQVACGSTEKDVHKKFKKNVMCEWLRRFAFVRGKTILEIEYEYDVDYNDVLKLIDDLGYSEYME